MPQNILGLIVGNWRRHASAGWCSCRPDHLCEVGLKHSRAVQAQGADPYAVGWVRFLWPAAEGTATDILARKRVYWQRLGRQDPW